MRELISHVEDGYRSEEPPCSITSMTTTDEAKILGFLLKENGKPMPKTVECKNSIWNLDGTAKAVIASPKNNKAGVVYINGNNVPRILREKK